MHHDAKKMIAVEIEVAGSLCAKLGTDWPRRGAPWATDLYLPPPL